MKSISAHRIFSLSIVWCGIIKIFEAIFLKNFLTWSVKQEVEKEKILQRRKSYLNHMKRISLGLFHNLHLSGLMNNLLERKGTSIKGLALATLILSPFSNSVRLTLSDFVCTGESRGSN